jgi:apolipoprotein N-acyltransferase
VNFRFSCALAILSGFLYFAAFPGIDFWPLAFVALAPLIVALEQRTPRQAAFLGWLSGFTMTMLGFSWLLEMLQTFSGFSLPICFVFMALLCSYQAGRIAMLGWLYARATRHGWPRLGSFALAFIASELLFPLLFPWYFGATVHQVPTLTQVAELGNPIAVGLVLLAVNWIVGELTLARVERRKPRWKTCAALALVPLVSVAYGALRIAQVDEDVARVEKIRVGVVQANMSLFAKRVDRSEGLVRHLDLTQQLNREKPLDLVVWSETSIAGAIAEGRAPEFYRGLFAEQLGIPTIFGGLMLRPVGDARKYVLYNSALLSDKSGTIVGRYDKQYLLAFGEYLPLGDTFPILYDWSPNTGKFTRGTTLTPLPLGEHRISVHICYEDILPAFVNRMVAAEPPDLLVNITNDAWFGDSTEPWIHLALATFRAIEHRRFFVRSTNSGVSAIVDPVGRVLEHSDTFKEQGIAGDVAYLRPSRTPYELYGDLPWWLCSVVIVGFAFVPRDRFRKRPAAGC